MSASPKRHLRILESGEIPEDAPSYPEALVQIEMLTRDIAGKRLRIAKLEKDRDAEAREDELWPQAVALFRHWQERTGHTRTRFTGDRFYLVAPFIRREGIEPCRDAIEGMAASDYHAKRGAYEQRDGPKYDRFELVFRSQADFERFRDMAPNRPETIRRASMLEHANEIAERVLEMGELMTRTDNPETIAYALAAIYRLNLQWIDGA